MYTYMSICVCISAWNVNWNGTQKQRESSYVSKKKPESGMSELENSAPHPTLSCFMFFSHQLIHFPSFEPNIFVRSLSKIAQIQMNVRVTHRKTSGWNRFGKNSLSCVFSFLSIYICVCIVVRFFSWPK